MIDLQQQEEMLIAIGNILSKKLQGHLQLGEATDVQMNDKINKR